MIAWYVSHNASSITGAACAVKCPTAQSIDKITAPVIITFSAKSMQRIISRLRFALLCPHSFQLIVSPSVLCYDFRVPFKRFFYKLLPNAIFSSSVKLPEISVPSRLISIFGIVIPPLFVVIPLLS